MDVSPALRLVYLVSFGILSGATLLTWLMRLLKPANETLRKVMTIVKSWWIMIAVFLLGLTFAPYGLAVLFYALSAFAVREYLRISRLSHLRTKLFVVFFAALTIQYLVLILQSWALYFAILPLMVIWILPTVIVLSESVENIAEVFGSTVGPLLLTYNLSYVPALALFLTTRGDKDSAVIAVMVLVLLTEGNDVFQFLAGKSFGKHKIVPRISPNKTAQGFAGGVVMTGLVSFLLVPRLLGVSAGQAVAIGVCISLAGVLGDLFFSAVKRYFGIKDFSALIPGHGGLLDRLDSLIFTAPIYFHLLYSFRGGSL